MVMLWFWKYGRRWRAAWTKDKANEVDRMLCAFYILDKRDTNGVVGGSDVD